MTKIYKILTIVMIVALVSVSACVKQAEKTSPTPKETPVNIGKVAPTIGKTVSPIISETPTPTIDKVSPTPIINMTPTSTVTATVGKVSPTSMIRETPTATIGATKILEVTVDIKGLAFKPSVIKIARGTKVTWTQSDSISHTVTSTIPGNVLNSPVLSNGQTYSYTFNDDGTFEYICSIHPSMKGTVIVDG